MSDVQSVAVSQGSNMGFAGLEGVITPGQAAVSLLTTVLEFEKELREMVMKDQGVGGSVNEVA
jgi:hypothetical protein